MTQYKFIITDISRAHSSGYENSCKKIFETIEQVAEYLQNTWYDDFCEVYCFPEEWDEADMNCPFPSKDEFSLDKIKEKIAKTKYKQCWDFSVINREIGYFLEENLGYFSSRLFS